MTIENLYLMLGEMIEDGLGNYEIIITNFENNASTISDVKAWEDGNIVRMRFEV